MHYFFPFRFLYLPNLTLSISLPYFQPLCPAAGRGSAVSSPAGPGGGAPAANEFWRIHGSQNTPVYTVAQSYTATVKLRPDFHNIILSSLVSITMTIEIESGVVICVKYAICRQRPRRKPCCGRKTARCRCKIRYVSKFTAASRGSLCDRTPFVIIIQTIIII